MTYLEISLGNSSELNFEFCNGDQVFPAWPPSYYGGNLTMASFDGTSKSSEGKGQNIPYHKYTSPAMEKLKAEVMAKASPEAIAYLDPLNYQGPKVIVDASTLTDVEWQEMRKKSIGSSAVSQVFGDCPYPDTTNLDLYYSKIGQPRLIPETKEDKEKKERMFLYGHLMEEYLHLVTRQMWPKSNLLIDTNIYADPKRPFLTANLDGMMQLSDGSYIHIEYKTTSEFGDDAYANGAIPPHYKRQLIQCQHIMGVWKSRLIVALSRDNIIVRDYVRDLDEEMEQVMEAENFWNNNVLAHIPPAPLGEPKNVVQTIRNYSGYGDTTIPEIALSPNIMSDVTQYFDAVSQTKVLNNQIKALERVKEQCMISIAAAMGTGTKGYVTDGKKAYSLTWKPQKGRVSCDTQRLQLDYPDLYAQYCSTGKESRPMKIKEAEVK